MCLDVTFARNENSNNDMIMIPITLQRITVAAADRHNKIVDRQILVQLYVSLSSPSCHTVQ